MKATLVWRHRKENLKKCSLRGLEGREDMCFLTYPQEPLPDLSDYVVLGVDGPPLTRADSDKGLVLIDGTWRYAAVMGRKVGDVQWRSLPLGYKTAYPRRQDEERGLASAEALYIAYHVLGWDTEGLLDHYHWREPFLKQFGERE